MKTAIILSVVFACTSAAELVDMKKVAAQADAILLEGVVPGQMVRQCSCQEQGICVEEMKEQVKQCSAECTDVLKQITDTPQQLMQCVEGVSPKIYNFISCAQDNLKSCVESNDGPKTPYHDLNKMFEIGERNLLANKEQLLSTGMLAKMRPVAENALSFAGCVKNCFTKKNAAGYCFDRYRCQPLITSASLTHSLKACSRGINWKTEAAGMCKCAKSSGVRGLENVCPLLMVMG